MTIRSQSAFMAAPAPAPDEAGDFSTTRSAQPAATSPRELTRSDALKQLRPRPERNVEDNASTSSAADTRAPLPLGQRIKALISRRQVSVTAVIPGTGRTLNRPLRATVPSTSVNPVMQGPEAAILEEAKLLSSVAESLTMSIGRPEAALWKRPAPSKAYRLMTTLIPWAKPAPLAKIAASSIGGNGRHTAPTHQTSPNHFAGKAAIAESVATLRELVAQRRAALDEAVAHFERAQSAHDAARGVSMISDQTQNTATRRLHAAAAVRDASSALHAVISGPDLAGLEGLRYLAEQRDKADAFTRKRINELQAKAHALRAHAYDRRDAIDLELQVRKEEAHALRFVDHDLDAAEKIVLDARGRLHNLEKRFGKLPSGFVEMGSTSPKASALHADLLNQIAQARTVLQGAERARARALQGLDSVNTGIERVSQQLSELMQLRATAEAQREQAERSLAWLTEASSLLARQADTTAAPEAGGQEQSVNALHDLFVARQSDLPPAFGQRPDARLQSALAALPARLKASSSPSLLPTMMAMETVIHALADVTQSDAGRATRLLDALHQHPTTHWSALAQTEAETRRLHSASTAFPNPTAADVLAFSRAIAALPRGSDLLHALSRDSHQTATKEQIQALHVFWTAEAAGRTEPDTAVSAWLSQARQVALARCKGDENLEFDDVAYAAYNAVRSGYVSNAPGSLYARHDARMRKALTEWVIRATSADNRPNDAPRPAVWRRFVPTLNKTPFSKRLLNRGYEVSESMGLDSARMQVDRAIRRRMTRLTPLIEASRQHRGGEGTLDALFSQTLLDYLKRLDNRGRHLSKVTLSGRDAKKIIERLPSVVRTMHAARFQSFIKQVAPHGATAYETVSRLEERLRAHIPSARQPPALETVDADLAAAIGLLKHQRLRNKEDIVTFFKPFILDMALRDKVRLGGGGTLGVGLPTLPYGPQTPIVSPLLSVETSRSDEAFTQLFMPVLGIEMMFGKARTNAHEATIGMVAGASLGTYTALQGTASVHGLKQHAKTDATLLRFFRKRHQDETMRANMLNALDSMVRWDVIAPERGRAYHGPLEAVFARNPDVSVSQMESVADTTAISAAVTARLPYVRFNDPDAQGLAQTFRVEPSLTGEGQRVRERRDERGGHVSVYAAVGDTAQQRANIGLTLTGAPVSYLPPSGRRHAHNTGTQRQALGLQLGVTRDIALAIEKHEISPFLIDGKQDGDLDRHYATPADMLREISANRTQWLMRCVETLEPDENGNTDTPDNRMRAGILLDAFEHEIKRLGKDNQYCLYNVNYSMRGAASGWIDGYRGLAQLARKRGDTQGERRALEAIDDILLNSGTWRPLMLIVRERAKDSTTLGWRNLLRWQRLANVDGQRTAVQFPPP